MIASISDTPAPLPGLLEALGGFQRLLFVERGTAGTRRQPRKARQQTGGVGVDGGVCSVALPPSDGWCQHGRLGGRSHTADATAVPAQGPSNSLTPIADPCRHARAGMPTCVSPPAQPACSRTHRGLSHTASPCLIRGGRGRYKTILNISESQP